jgi:hypothetical protein
MSLDFRHDVDAKHLSAEMFWGASDASRFTIREVR